MVTLDDKVVAEVLPPEEVIGVLSRFVAVFESPKKPTPLWSHNHLIMLQTWVAPPNI